MAIYGNSRPGAQTSSPFRFTQPANTAELQAKIGVAQFTAAVVPDFKAALEAAWKPEIRRVVLDLSAVEFIDSSGVGALLGVQKRLTPQGEPVALRGLRPAVSSVLELLRLQRVFKIE